MKGTIVAQVDSSESFQEFCSTGCLGAYENKQNPPKSGLKTKCTVCGKLTEVSLCLCDTLHSCALVLSLSLRTEMTSYNYTVCTNPFSTLQSNSESLRVPGMAEVVLLWGLLFSTLMFVLKQTLFLVSLLGSLSFNINLLLVPCLLPSSLVLSSCHFLPSFFSPSFHFFTASRGTLSALL